MLRRSLFVLVALMSFAPAAHAAPTQQQLCESAMELASAKYAQCRLTAESKYAKTLDAAKRTSAFLKCSANLGSAFTKATLKYGVACAATEQSSAFDEYLKQCSNDATAAAGGAALPDYVGDLAICNADLGTCNGDLATCTGDLATTTADLATCEGDLAACEALPPARLLKTGQTTSYGAGSDGDLELGIAQDYVDNGDGTITDTKTGLMWEKKSDDGSIHDKDNTYTWGLTSPPYTMNGTVVTTFLATLNTPPCFAGQCDWRLPNVREIMSIAAYATGSPSVAGAFNAGCIAACGILSCSCAAADNHWSSTTAAAVASEAWFVAGDGAVLSANKSASLRARAVRGGL